ncbi:MAG: putative toxin-antitoxin system toxin component, PIN family [Verrucomicrobiales bacterium]|nr:putative toxin-antitoxin system toxin component, PIN family [Verrucomicrobiales bacterium]
MIPAVFDCGVVVSALGWSGNPRFCLDLVYAGQVDLCVTTEVWAEYCEKVPEVLTAERRPVDAEAELARLLKRVRFVTPSRLGKRRGRDPEDERYLAAALGAQAAALVSNDRDLLILGKPFGVPILTPIEFLRLVRSP